ncbi:MAG: polysaccharide biosynthesis tyrosine autokinase [Hyphomicrobiales bacterium]|nr:polysaccharide biosynthesis tyrosine autokinase [Hyphomicrobiales bacterium]
MAAVFCATLALTVLALVILPTRYLASGSIIVAEQEPSLAHVSAAWAQKIGDPADLESQLLVIRSPRMLRLAMASPDALATMLEECRYRATRELLGRLGGVATCERLAIDADAQIEYLEARYSVGSVGRSRVISIGYKSPLPEVARRMANALITAFLDDHRAGIAGGREVAATWLRQELQQLNDELRDGDGKIQAFRRAKGLMRGSNAPIASERLTSISQQLSSAEAARAEAAARLAEIRADQARGSSDSPAVLASRIVADLKQQMTVVSGQLASVASALGPRHPARLALQQELATLQQRLRDEVASIAASAQQSLIAAEALVASLQRQVEEVKTEVANATSDEASIESMVRDTEVKRQQYAELYKRASELETERRVLLGSTRLVALAELPLTPFFPKSVPFLAAGFTLALMLAVAAALSRERLSPRAQSIVSAPSSDAPASRPRDAPPAAPVLAPPVLAMLPRLRMLGPRSLPSDAGNTTAPLPALPVALRLAQLNVPLQGALGRLTTALMQDGYPPRTILVTSAAPGEGKTFTALALAQFIAAMGWHVLVVECDLRRPVFAKALGPAGRNGLADLLRGSAAADDIIVTTELATLDQIPAGQASAADGDLLARQPIAALADWAQRYRLVLLDGPSAQEAAEVCALARQVDGVLCCSAAARTASADIAAIVGRAGGKVLGRVVTLAPAHEPPRSAPDEAYREAS